MSNEEKEQNPQSEDAAEKKEAERQRMDWFLRSLVAQCNNWGAITPITLNVGGLLISGMMIGGRQYFEEFGKKYIETYKSQMDMEALADLSKYFKELSESFGPFSPETKDPPIRISPHYIHIKNARFFLGHQGTIPSDAGVLWRGRLESVDGFWFGLIGPAVTK